MKTIALILAAAAAFACKSAPSAGEEVAFRSLARGYQSGIAEPGLRVARTDSEWRALWERHASLLIPRADAPAVDFARDMVVYVSVGARPTYGYSVEIEKLVVLDDAHLRLEVLETKPAPDAITSQMQTNPYHMIVAPRHSGAIELAPR